MAGYELQPTGFDRFKAAMKQKQPANFYVFYGEEAYLRAHWLDRLHRLLVEPFAEAFNYRRFTQENFTARAFADSVEAVPMMAEHTLVQADDIDLFKLDEDERGVMAACLSDLPDYCTVVLVYETVEFKQDKRIKKLAEAFRKAELVEFKTPSERELTAWIARHFKSHGKTISDAVSLYLLQLTGGSMTTLASEIGKIAAFTEREQITEEDLDAVVEPVLEAVAFELSDAVAAGRYDRAMEKLEILLQMQQEPIPTLAAISSQMRRILTAKTLLRAGKSAQDLKTLCGMSEYPAKKTMEFARRLPEAFCEQAVVRCMETDYRMKTGYDEPERLLELLVLTLAEEARHA